VELVTASGLCVKASETENPDLFWALHGGGGNFRVATAFEFPLHAVGPMVLAGLLAWPADAAVDVARVYRDVAFDPRDELGSALVLITAPPQEFVPTQLQGTTLVATAVLWAGEISDGVDAVKALRDLDRELDLVGPMPYSAFRCMLDDPPGRHNYWTADYHDDFPDDAVDIFIRYGLERKSPLAQQLLVPWGGAGRGGAGRGGGGRG
jgi:FAD/FMN-containing dehydrogenase